MLRDVVTSDDVVETVLASSDQLVALIDLPSRRVAAISPPLLAIFPDKNLVQYDGTPLVAGSGPSTAFSLLATGRIEGYELSREVRLPTGREHAYVWVHAIGEVRPPRAAVVVIETDVDSSDHLPGLRRGSSLMVIGTVDDEWRFDRLSADVSSLLGRTADDLHGTSILALLHPGDLGNFLTGLGQATTAGSGVAVRLRLAAADGEWQWTRGSFSPLELRSGFAFVITRFGGAPASDDRVQNLEQALARIAHEVHAASDTRRVSEMPALAELPALGRLTSREWEVVTKARAGASPDQVARSLHLSPSTVRNHLSSVYRKLGVNSLPGLLVLLHRDNSLVAS